MNITARNALLLASALLTSLSTQAINSDHFVPPFLPASVSTVPSNGDTNPYGVAFVPEDFDEEECELVPGDILVSNFNNSLGQEGTGSTIVRVAKDHSVSTFFATPNATLGAPGTGLTTALEILKSGFVIVGSLPSSVTSPGQLDPSNPGSLLVIDAHGNLVETITDPKINGPWDMTVSDHEDYVLAFVSNVIDGTVIRIKLDVDESGVWAKKI
ncbi:MAG TPA: hypothetical protein VEK06_04280, partial [Myxococcota bacterium]|nr:hypothetical protein [Myxococcota bacterium]